MGAQDTGSRAREEEGVNMTLRCPYCSAEIDLDEERDYIGESIGEDPEHETVLHLNYRVVCPDCTETFIWRENFVYRFDNTLTMERYNRGE